MKDSCVPFTQIHSLLIYCFICLIILFLSLYVCRVCILLCYFFHESFARKLSTSCLFIPKYFDVHFLMGKMFHMASGTTVGRVRKKHSVGECLPGYRARAPAAETTKIEQGKCNAQASQHLQAGSSSSSARSLWPWELWSLNFLRRINEGKGNQQMLPDAGTRNAGEAESPLASASLLSEVTCTFSPGPHQPTV